MTNEPKSKRYYKHMCVETCNYRIKRQQATLNKKNLLLTSSLSLLYVHYFAFTSEKLVFYIV